LCQPSCNLFSGKIIDAEFSDGYTEIGQSGTIPSGQGKKILFAPRPFCRPIENAGAAQFYMEPPGLPLSLLHYFFSFNLL